MAESLTRTEQSTPLLSVPNERAEVSVRQLRVANVSGGTEALTRQTGTEQIAVSRALPRPHRPKPAIRRLEEALNGGDSPHRAYADLFEALTICLAAGMPVATALEKVTQGAEPPLQRMCADVGMQVAAGVPIEQAFVRWQTQLPEVILPLLEHGARHGTPAQATRRLTQVLQRFARLDEGFAYSALRPDLTLPLLLCGTMPFMSGLIQSLPVFVAYCAGCVGISFGVWYRRHQIGRRSSRNVKAARRALVKTRRGLANRYLGTARWARTFAALYECGVPISTALEAAAPAACNPHYAEALRRAAVQCREGDTLYDSLAGTRLLPDHLLETIRTAETAGDLGTALDGFADTLEQSAKMAAAQRFGMQIVAGLFCVAGLVVATLSPGIGLALIALGMVITWLLFLTSGRADR
jgi:type II secretory pathway component PulF